MNPTDRLEDTVRGTYRIYAYLIGGMGMCLPIHSVLLLAYPICSSVLADVGVDVRDGRAPHVVRQCFLGLLSDSGKRTHYLPYIYSDRDWLMREARFELERRERLGLPLVDPDLLPVDSIHLPSEEELGDFEIVI